VFPAKGFKCIIFYIICFITIGIMSIIGSITIVLKFFAYITILVDHRLVLVADNVLGWLFFGFVTIV